MNFNSEEDIVNELKPIVANWNGLSSSLSAIERKVIKDIYKFLFINKSKVFPKNPQKFANYSALSDMETCSKCIKTVMSHITGWYYNKTTK